MDTGHTGFPASGIKDFEFVLLCATWLYELRYALDQGLLVEEKARGSPKAAKTQLLRWSPRQVKLSAPMQYKGHRTAVVATYS